MTKKIVSIASAKMPDVKLRDHISDSLDAATAASPSLEDDIISESIIILRTKDGRVLPIFYPSMSTPDAIYMTEMTKAMLVEISIDQMFGE